MSDAGGSLDIVGATSSLDDEAAAQLPDAAQITTGSWRPADYEPTTDIFPAPAPVPSGNVNLSVFDGLSANGTWNLYLVDDAAADMGTITELVLTHHDLGRPTATTATATTTATTASATSATVRLRRHRRRLRQLQRRGDHDPRLGERDPLSVDLRRLRLRGTITDLNMTINGVSHTWPG